MTVKIVKLSRHVATLRIIFGLMWLIDAYFKWQPAFLNGFLDQIQSASQGQPSWLSPWFNFWMTSLGHSPHVFATLTAITETCIALALIFGFARRTTYLLAALFSLLIWSIPEGFGGPYSSSSTDIGTAVTYAVVFFALYGLDRMAIPPRWSVDTFITKRLPWWAIVANP